MAKNKYYAVRKGQVPGVYDNWPECEAQVKGFPGAEYKSFKSAEEAAAYMREGGIETYAVATEPKHTVSAEISGRADKKPEPTLLPTEKSKQVIAMLEELMHDDRAVAFTDGSYNEKTGTYGYGAILRHFDIFMQARDCGSDPKLAKMRNVAGEIMGAMKIMSYCVEHGIKAVDIYHDYEGISKWPLKEWQAKKPGTIEYVKFYEESVKDKLDVKFIHVKGHSGNALNDYVDRLAKTALGLIPNDNK